MFSQGPFKGSSVAGSPGAGVTRYEKNKVWGRFRQCSLFKHSVFYSVNTEGHAVQTSLEEETNAATETNFILVNRFLTSHLRSASANTVCGARRNAKRIWISEITDVSSLAAHVGKVNIWIWSLCGRNDYVTFGISASHLLLFLCWLERYGSEQLNLSCEISRKLSSQDTTVWWTTLYLSSVE